MRGHIEKRGKDSYSIASDGAEQIRGVIQRGIRDSDEQTFKTRRKRG